MKKELTCPLCKRPYRKPNIGLYNIPDVGALCIDCFERVKSLSGIQSSMEINAIKGTISRINRHKNSVEIRYSHSSLNGFKITFYQDNYGTIVGLTNLEQLKEVRDALDAFIKTCEVDYKK